PAHRAPRHRAPALNVGEPLDPRNTFDTFVIGSSNTFAAAAAKAVVDKPGCTYNPLFVHGGTGLGKTHLIQAIAQATLARGNAHVCYTTCEIFTNEFISALKAGDLVNFRKKYRSIDLLLIDDIHFLAGKNSTQEEFFHTFNALYQSQKQIVMTSDRPLSEIAGLEKRLVSRFEWGLTAEMEMADFETRVAILRNKREQMEFAEVSDDAIDFIAKNVRSNIRKLEGALLRVASYASLTHKEMTTEVLEVLLREVIENNPTALTIETIQRTVAEHYDLRLGDMTSKQRPANIAFPRQIAMYLCRELTDQSFPAIANAFGRNHSTVVHAHDAVAEKMRTDSALRQTILSLQQRLDPTRR
ncbi:MAG: chromosomal replication initiator protein DnaA, partial [Kiritimatiellae bacterium]|nr:chromosomal replication initiator protein DnaA [Kiritimatiellia bacterium]